MAYKNQLKKIVYTTCILASAISSAQAQSIGSLNEADYTVPTWTKLVAAYKQLQAAQVPYSINMVLNGDPRSRVGFNWFTNPTTETGEVQLVEKADATDADFAGTGVLTFKADVRNASLNYFSKKNQEEIDRTGIQVGEIRNYTAHKTVATGLKPGTTYSFRVGSSAAWSTIGSFTTAKDDKSSFSFVYITDTQANTADMFDVTQKTVHRAFSDVPDASFLLCNGDFVETSGSSNSEWEWEQWFATMQDCWMKKPIVAVQGNHDTSSNSNFFYHFNTDTTYNTREGGVPTAMNGTVYSFVYGDALFLVVNYEDWKTPGYFESLAQWMRDEVAKYPTVKWRIATYHKCMFTGSRSHQSDADEVAMRQAMLPVYDELKIDLALQGHDHIYEVMGPVVNTSKTLDAGAIEEQIDVTGGVRENMTGKQGGVYNVANGTLYFLNNSAGKKKYEPRDEEQMASEEQVTLVPNYWGLFSGKFGQTGEPTYSAVTVTTDTIKIVTYTVDGNGKATEFDSFKIVKDATTTTVSSAKNTVVSMDVDANRNIVVEGISPEKIELFDLNGVLRMQSASINTLDVSTVGRGAYLVKATASGRIYTKKIVL
ncbi:MAG: fibronectin type III domain-containing protein [Prevotella sp.]|nr:fibronectin type III domain-containing protein [Prevotella sp.]